MSFASYSTTCAADDGMELILYLLGTTQLVDKLVPTGTCKRKQWTQIHLGHDYMNASTKYAMACTE